MIINPMDTLNTWHSSKGYNHSLQHFLFDLHLNKIRGVSRAHIQAVLGHRIYVKMYQLMYAEMSYGHDTVLIIYLSYIFRFVTRCMQMRRQRLMPARAAKPTSTPIEQDALLQQRFKLLRRATKQEPQAPLLPHATVLVPPSIVFQAPFRLPIENSKNMVQQSLRVKKGDEPLAVDFQLEDTERVLHQLQYTLCLRMKQSSGGP